MSDDKPSRRTALVHKEFHNQVVEELNDRHGIELGRLQGELSKASVAAASWESQCNEAKTKARELKGERTTALDMVRDRIDADPSTMTEAVDGLLKLYKMEFDERLKLQAQLDRANTSLKDWKQRAARMALKAKPLLDRATEPRADASARQTWAELQRLRRVLLSFGRDHLSMAKFHGPECVLSEAWNELGRLRNRDRTLGRIATALGMEYVSDNAISDNRDLRVYRAVMELKERATEPRPIDPDYHERCESELQWWRQTHTDEEPPADIWGESACAQVTKRLFIDGKPGPPLSMGFATEPRADLEPRPMSDAARAEVLLMREAFGRCRSMLRLSDCADIGSVVRSVSDVLDERFAAVSEVQRLEALLKISADTNAKLIARLGKEAGA